MIDNKRLNLFLEDKRISTKELAEKLGITHSAVSLIRSGKNQMRAGTFAKLLDIFPDLCPKWLMTGEGSPTCAANIQAGNDTHDISKDREIQMLKDLVASKDLVIKLLSQIADNANHDK